MTTRIVLDCDTGTDDAVAIMLAALHPDLDLLAVSTVNGNVALPNTTENTLRVLDHIGAAVPVHAGAARPFVRPDFPIPRDVLNAGNPDFQVAHLDLPPSVTPVQDSSAVRMLVDTFSDPANADVVLVVTGPLTNVALALIAEPRLASRIHSLVLMGGAARVSGNVTATAEFNLWVDPEAARTVFSAGLREIVVVPLDATHSASMTLADCDAFDALGTTAGSTAAAMLRHRIRQDQTPDSHKSQASAPLHDPLCIAYLLRPEVVTSSGRHPVSVETTGEQTLGQLVVDTRPWTPEPANATVAFAASAPVFREVLLEAFAPGPARSTSAP
ncbi:purine nucleosidase [Actinopolymorpha cephalotaxi]|uniref:Inosine-uridine nucleoside N-ribohydrolase n=1 Tax=Actinopolymorpha cephalotaxi TaxID=504797 RepID=A0A1I3A6G7_9ACTN|nr:nucleoside hydrolase [Actinopolymorpha cephalotaxi]NYH85317.1 inosine-uridine nucleoside N-ribohydrolase [Actinopolymorpha cephalotaxi]SFH45598.1 purine nucleosidase [Actinopolymorpha cephalotaxi]